MWTKGYFAVRIEFWAYDFVRHFVLLGIKISKESDVKVLVNNWQKNYLQNYVLFDNTLLNNANNLRWNTKHIWILSLLLLVIQICLKFETWNLTNICTRNKRNAKLNTKCSRKMSYLFRQTAWKQQKSDAND